MALFQEENKGFITINQRPVEQVIAAGVSLLNAFPITFHAAASASAIEKRANELIQQLTELIEKNETLNGAQGALECDGWHPKIVDVYRQKLDAIRIAAEQRQQEVDKAKSIVSEMVERIKRFSIDFEDVAPSHQAVEVRRKHLMNKLRALENDSFPILKNALNTLGIPIENDLAFYHAISDCEEQIDCIASATRMQIDFSIKAAKTVVQRTPYLEYLVEIQAKATEIALRARHNEDYQPIALIAKKLSLGLETIKEDFLSSGKPLKSNLEEFQTRSIAVINQAKEQNLTLYPGWKDTLAKLTRVLTSLSTDLAAPVVAKANADVLHPGNRRFRFFFTPPTENNSKNTTPEPTSQTESSFIGG